MTVDGPCIAAAETLSPPRRRHDLHLGSHIESHTERVYECDGSIEEIVTSSLVQDTSRALSCDLL